MPFGAILGSVASSVAGKLFGGSGKTTTTNTSTVDYASMVRRALKAGFNPLTVLQNGGAAGFASNTQTSATDIDPIAATFAGIAQGVGDHFATQSERRLLDAQTDLAQAQAANLRAFASAGPTGNRLLDVSGHQDSDPRVIDQNQRTGATRRTATKTDEPEKPAWLDEDTPLYIPFETKSGTQNLPVGPDIDELITGIGIEGFRRARTKVEDVYQKWTDPRRGRPAPRPKFAEPGTTTTNMGTVSPAPYIPRRYQ